MAERVRAMVVGQKELMAGVSHELRSPLARMKVSLELMRKATGASTGWRTSKPMWTPSTTWSKSYCSPVASSSGRLRSRSSLWI